MVLWISETRIGGNPHETEKKKTYTTTTERKSFGELFWPQRKTFQAGGGYKNPIKTQENHIHHRNLCSVDPIFFCKEKFCTGTGRCMVSFSQRKDFQLPQHSRSVFARIGVVAAHQRGLLRFPGQRTEHVKTRHVKTDRFRGHFRGHFRGTFRGAFRGESSKGSNRKRTFVGTLVGTLVGPLVGPLVGTLVDPLAVRVLCASPISSQVFLRPPNPRSSRR